MRFAILFLFLLCCRDLQAVIDLQPHRAYYTLTMVGRPSALADIRGTLLVEVNKADGGWTTQHLSETWLYYVDGTADHVREGFVTYEAEDGALLKFHAYRWVNNDPIETMTKGVVHRKGKVLDVTYTHPEKKKQTLSPACLFPLQYRKALIEAARKGEKLFPQLVFEREGAVETNTFISTQRTEDAGHKLAGQTFWPIRSAIYSPTAVSYEPLSTTTQDLFPNGIIGQYVTDHEIEGAKVHGVLDRIELLQEAPAPLEK